MSLWEFFVLIAAHKLRPCRAAPCLTVSLMGCTCLASERSIQFGANEMYLESPPPFKPAHKLYRKNGFEMIKEYPEVSIPHELRADWVYTKKSSLRKDTWVKRTGWRSLPAVNFNAAWPDICKAGYYIIPLAELSSPDCAAYIDE